MITQTVEWQTAQSCAECGTEAAYVRHEHGEAICRVCGHENPMDAWSLGENEFHVWVGGDHGDWPAVLYVVAYAVEDDES